MVIDRHYIMDFRGKVLLSPTLSGKEISRTVRSKFFCLEGGFERVFLGLWRSYNDYLLLCHRGVRSSDNEIQEVKGYWLGDYDLRTSFCLRHGVLCEVRCE